VSADYALRRPRFPTAVTALTMPEPSSSTLFQHTPQTDHDGAGILITLRWNQRSRWVGNPDHHEAEYALELHSTTEEAAASPFAASFYSDGQTVLVGLPKPVKGHSGSRRRVA
jgi:hypothetical protein